ncbi:MAG: hypothetical protein ABI184_01555 [Ginsengibacter sp.]
MRKEELDEFIKSSFKKIKEYFHKAIEHFEAEDIRKFRIEIRKLKVFLRLISMESEDGLSCNITRKMRVIYGYLGIIQNFHLQLDEASGYLKKSSKHIPVFYVKTLEKEFKYWKSLSSEYIDPDYDFFNDEYEILATLPGQLTNKSITSFINYTLYEIGEISGRQGEEALDNARKFIEDIYYNLPVLKPFLTKQQSILFDEKELGEWLSLFINLRVKRKIVVLLQTFSTDALEQHEKQLIKQMENEWLREKKEINEQLTCKLDAMHIRDNHLNELSLQE